MTGREYGPFWICASCNAQNHEIDSECAYCEAHECYVTGADWVAAGRPENCDMPCSRCGKMVRSR